MSGPENSVTRRRLLQRGAGAAASALVTAAGLSAMAGTAHGFQRGDDLMYDFIIPRVKFDCKGGVDFWNVGPGGDKNLLEALSKSVRCRTRLEPGCDSYNPYYGDPEHFNAVVTFNTFEELRDYPFLFMTAEGKYTFNRTQRANLKRYLDEGGFLLMDDCVATPEVRWFYDSSAELLKEVFGASSVRRIPVEHEVFHNVFDFGDGGLPQVAHYKPPKWLGVFRGERLAVFLSSTDIHCGWIDRRNKWYEVKGSYNPHQAAMQIGINIIMYAMTR